MFAIYGTSGQMFRGPLEAFRQVAPTLRLSRVRAIDPDAEQPARPQPAPAAPGTAVRRPAQALNQYTAIGHPPPTRHPLSTVRDIMSAQPRSVPDSATVLQAWQALSEQGVGQAPVVDPLGRLVGLLSRGELMRPDRLPTPETPPLVWRALLMQPVTELMVSPVPAVWPDTDIRRLAQALLDTGLPGMPVVDDSGALLGFVSRSDILKAVVHDPPLDIWS